MMLPAIAVVFRPWPPKPLAIQKPGESSPSLRHPVQRAAEHARPDVLDLDVADLRIDLCNVGLELVDEAARIGFPGGRAPRPQQTVAVDDAVMVVGEIGVAHRAAIADGVEQARPERGGGDQ